MLTDVSEVHTASIIRAMMEAVCPELIVLMMEAVCTSETSVSICLTTGSRSQKTLNFILAGVRIRNLTSTD
jgi:hypothetical protein